MVSNLENFYESLSRSILNIDSSDRLRALLADRKRLQIKISNDIRFGKGKFIDGSYVESDLNSKIIVQIENILFLLD